MIWFRRRRAAPDCDTPAPYPRKPEACKGCANYHGHMHGHDMLICAIHPYGPEETPCPDWEPKNSPHPKNFSNFRRPRPSDYSGDYD